MAEAMNPTPDQKAAAKRLRAAADKRRVRYVVRYQWRRPEGLREGGDPQNWRDWRIFAAVPILFYSADEAWDYTHMVGTFKNINGRKPSCCVQRKVLAA